MDLDLSGLGVDLRFYREAAARTLYRVALLARPARTTRTGPHRLDLHLARCTFKCNL